MKNEALIQKRENRNLTQEKVARTVGISNRYYQKIEAGTCKPNVEMAISLAKLLGCEVTDIFNAQEDCTKE